MMVIGYILLALVAGIIGGAIGGIVVGGKHLGNELAAMMGGGYGGLPVVPGIVVAIILLAIF